MPDLTVLFCNTCDSYFERPTKEVTRRIKIKSDTKWFCTRTCAGSHLAKNFGSNGPSELNRLTTSQRSLGNEYGSKYTSSERDFCTYIRRVNSRRWPSDLSLEFLMELWDEQEGLCAFSLIPLEHPKKSKSFNTQASLDRIDSTKGYLQGNVQFVSASLNLAKGARSDQTVFELMDLIVKHHKPIKI